MAGHDGRPTLSGVLLSVDVGTKQRSRLQAPRLGQRRIDQTHTDGTAVPALGAWKENPIAVLSTLVG